MSKSPPLRVALSADGVSIWSPEIFGDAEPSRLREFLARTFAVEEVRSVELRRTKSFGRVHYHALGNPAQLWKKLSRVLSSADDSGASGRVDAGVLYLEGHGDKPLRISRIGEVLSTWRVRYQGVGRLRLWHPVLRNRRDLVFRLEEELAAIVGVEEFSASALTGKVSIRYDGSATTAERIARELEKAWPRLLAGVDGPPSQKRLAAAVSLAALAFTGQYLAPAVRPIALVGMTLYSSPNVVNAAKQLARGQVGVSALYSTGVAFMLISGSPFAASIMATLMQFWPRRAHDKMVSSQRRLFAGQRRRPTWARTLHADGAEVELSVDDLQAGDRVVVRSGEIVPVDGVVEDGLAAVLGEPPFASSHLEDSSPGDAVAAGAIVSDGRLTIRVERAGMQTCASRVASFLPHGTLDGLPSSQKAEYVADRSARPVLALSLLNLLLTGNLRRSQGVIRPDYATAPRLSAQLSALRGLAQGLASGVFFRNPAALDRLAGANVYVLDDSAGLDRRRLEVAGVASLDGVSRELLVGYAHAAHRTSRSEQGRALGAAAPKGKSVHPQAGSVRRLAGATRYRDRRGRAIEVATSEYLAASSIDVPARFEALFTRRLEATEGGAANEPANDERSLRPLWVLRDERVIGVVSFARSGDLVGKPVVAKLRSQNENARIVYLSRKGQAETAELGRRLGIEFAQGGLTPAEKVDLIRNLGGATLWFGDGSDPDARDAILASSASISVAALSRSHTDAADILLPREGLSHLSQVIALGRAHAARLARDYRTVYTVNLLGVAAAFIAGFNGLQSGLLSNVGTALVYVRHARSLDRLADVAEKKRARLTSVVSH